MWWVAKPKTALDTENNHFLTRINGKEDTVSPFACSSQSSVVGYVANEVLHQQRPMGRSVVIRLELLRGVSSSTLKNRVRSAGVLKMEVGQVKDFVADNHP
jgi:hypothetical protein